VVSFISCSFSVRFGVRCRWVVVSVPCTRCMRARLFLVSQIRRAVLPRTSQSRSRLGARSPQSAPRLTAPACSVPEWRRAVGPMSSVDPSIVTQQDYFVQNRMSRHRWANVCAWSRLSQVCSLLRSRRGQGGCSTARAASAHDHPSPSSSASGTHAWTLASCCRLE